MGEEVSFLESIWQVFRRLRTYKCEEHWSVLRNTLNEKGHLLFASELQKDLSLS
jgi:hypothetical protein